MVRQCGLQADVAGSVDVLRQRQGVDGGSEMAPVQAIEPSANPPDFAGADGAFDQGVQPVVAAVDPTRRLKAREDPFPRLLDGNFSQGLHVQDTVIF